MCGSTIGTLADFRVLFVQFFRFMILLHVSLNVLNILFIAHSCLVWMVLSLLG